MTAAARPGPGHGLQVSPGAGQGQALFAAWKGIRVLPRPPVRLTVKRVALRQADGRPSAGQPLSEASVQAVTGPGPCRGRHSARALRMLRRRVRVAGWLSRAAGQRPPAAARPLRGRRRPQPPAALQSARRRGARCSTGRASRDAPAYMPPVLGRERRFRRRACPARCSRRIRVSLPARAFQVLTAFQAVLCVCDPCPNLSSSSLYPALAPSTLPGTAQGASVDHSPIWADQQGAPKYRGSIGECPDNLLSRRES